MSSSSQNPLGRATDYVSQYSPDLLYPIDRSEARRSLGINGHLPFAGEDIWTGYEVSWLDERGKPQVALAEFRIPCDSDCIIESKSFKLYLNSFNQTPFADRDTVWERLVADLSQAAGAPVQVALRPLAHMQPVVIGQFGGESLDGLPVTIEHYQPQPSLLGVGKEGAGKEHVEETLYTDLFKSNCPVTGQPDWASVQISYRGPCIDREGLLAYLVSFREHQDFHEHCVERIFTDLMAHCGPNALTVYARYTRRGGLDINPYRSTQANTKPESLRLIRQ